MLKKLTFLFFCFNFIFFSISQENNSYNQNQISVLTIGPGNALNDAFGHNGIRVKTPYNDVVYDYGRYPFNDPNFYLNFAKGKLNYSQGSSNYNDVIQFYKTENRSIKEQFLNLTNTEKKALEAYLIYNSLPENKNYWYDFFYDNCATKIRDVLQEATQNNIDFHAPKNLTEKSFRDLIAENLNWNSWGSFGINLALGSVIDKKATPYQYMFLPKYIYAFLENATLKSSKQALVTKSVLVFNKKEDNTKTAFYTSPFLIFTIISMIILCITFFDFKKHKRSKWLDFILFFITGVIGVCILLLWFATNHTATANNYNLLWAFAFNIVASFYALKSVPATWFKKYIKLLILLLLLMVIHWITGVQKFSVVLIPLIIALFFRYVFLITYYKKKIKLSPSKKYYCT